MKAKQHSTDYKQLLTRLCHLVVLSQTAKLEGVVDSLVLNVVEIDPNNPASNLDLISESLEVYFGLSFEKTDLETSISRLVTSNQLVKHPETGAVSLGAKARADQIKRITDAETLELTVANQWLDSVNPKSEPYSQEIKTELWNCLKAYLSRLFRRHGAQTSLIVSGQNFDDTDLDRSISDLLNVSVTQECKLLGPEVSKDALRAFFRNQTPERSRYIAQLLDGTFSFYTLFTDDATQEYLKKKLPRITLFLDTNFLYGILKLHDNPQNEVSTELVNLVRDQHLPFELYYHEESLLEMQHSIGKAQERLTKLRSWPSGLSKAALNTSAGRLSGIELKFHEENSKQQIDPLTFFTKYRHLQKLFNDHDFKLFRRPDTSNLNHLDKETTELINKYQSFLRAKGSKKAEHYETIKHDMIVWSAVKERQSKSPTGLDVGALMLSADQSLFAFDWGTLNKGNSLGVVVLPSQLLQLVRPFVPRTPDFDDKFAEMFSLPQFRSAYSNYGDITRRVLQFLASFKDISEETASAILADEYLLGRLRNTATDAELEEAIESEIIQINARLMTENTEARAELERAKVKLIETGSSLQGAGRKLSEKERALDQSETRLQAELNTLEIIKAASESVKSELLKEKEKSSRLTAEASIIQEQLEQSKRKNERIWKAIRCVIGSIIFVATSTAACWFLLSLPNTNNDWHPLSFCLASVLFCGGVCWIIFGWKHRLFAFGTTVVGVLIKIIGMF